jgi:hypothetical protein
MSVRTLSTSFSLLAEKKAPVAATPNPAAATPAKPAAPATKADGKPYVSDYDMYSYFDIESEMVKYRLPQPSSLPKNNFTYSKLPPKK